jgi:hypothetical protein
LDAGFKAVCSKIDYLREDKGITLFAGGFRLFLFLDFMSVHHPIGDINHIEKKAILLIREFNLPHGPPCEIIILSNYNVFIRPLNGFTTRKKGRIPYPICEG